MRILLKSPLLLFCLIVFTTACSTHSAKVIELPITFVQGFGGLQVEFGTISGRNPPENPWSKTEFDVSGIPDGWQNVNIESIWLDPHQFAFQNYKAGSISEDMFAGLVENWKIDVDSEFLSDKPIKCYVHILYGIDSDNKFKYKIDTNNNLDFSDETIFEPRPAFPKRDSNEPIVHSVRYERFKNGKIVELILPISISEMMGSLLYNFPVFAKAHLMGVELKISSGNFSTVDFRHPKLYHTLKGDPSEKFDFFRINGEVYQNLGVDLNQEVLLVKRIPKDSVVYSSQVGFQAGPITGKNFMTGEALSLASYKGKFVYLDFWGSWCPPCMEELPTLKEVHADIDTAKVVFVGIAFDNEKALKEIIEKEGISWAQILNTHENDIVKRYNVGGYPTTFIVDPEGRIVAKNIPASMLKDTLNYFVNHRTSGD